MTRQKCGLFLAARPAGTVARHETTPLPKHGAFTMDSHSHPDRGLIAYFVIIPMLLASLSAEAVLLAPDDWKTTIRNGFRRGNLTRACAFGAGLITGVG